MIALAAVIHFPASGPQRADAALSLRIAAISTPASGCITCHATAPTDLLAFDHTRNALFSENLSEASPFEVVVNVASATEKDQAKQLRDLSQRYLNLPHRSDRDYAETGTLILALYARGQGQASDTTIALQVLHERVRTLEHKAAPFHWQAVLPCTKSTCTEAALRVSSKLAPESILPQRIVMSSAAPNRSTILTHQLITPPSYRELGSHRRGPPCAGLGVTESQFDRLIREIADVRVRAISFFFVAQPTLETTDCCCARLYI